MVEPELETRPSSAPTFFGLCPSLGVEMCRREWAPSNVSCVSDYSDSTEVKFEELKNVKLEEDDEKFPKVSRFEIRKRSTKRLSWTFL